MPTASVLLCPPLPGESELFDAAEAAAQASLVGVTAVSPSLPEGARDERPPDNARRWVAECALRLRIANPPGPTLLVVQGAATEHVADLGFAVAAARRARSGYLLIGGPLPRAGLVEWPDAPVAVVHEDAAVRDAAALRGWELLTGHPPHLIRDLCERP